MEIVPKDVIKCHMLTYLDSRDLYRLGLTCRLFRDLIGLIRDSDKKRKVRICKLRKCNPLWDLSKITRISLGIGNI